MKRVILTIGCISITALSFACSTTTPNANANSNIAIVTTANSTNPVPNLANAPIQTANPTVNATPPPTQNGAIPGIPNSTAADAKTMKDDPTRNAKAQNLSTAAPDKSEVTVSLGQNAVETRVFNNNAQLAKVVRTQDLATNKTTVKVYLRNGQVKEIADGKLSDPMKDSAADILKAASDAKLTTPDAKTETTENSETPATEPRPRNPRERLKRLQEAQTNLKSEK
ncbi:MAG: hypothetical protein H7Z37_00910 [Pyrinomonadaceae bacterium]|nr:hypothetical protein [Pyrinomonadaceae bacterium]